MIERLVERREFDGVADLAEAYPAEGVSGCGRISEDGRENLMPYGTMVFNSFGPRNDLFDKAMANAGPVRDWIMSKCSRAALAPDGLGMQIFHAVDAGELSEDEAGHAGALVPVGRDRHHRLRTWQRALLFCAVIPSNGQSLRENPNLIRGAFEEVLALRGAGADLLPDHHEGCRSRRRSDR